MVKATLNTPKAPSFSSRILLETQTPLQWCSSCSFRWCHEILASRLWQRFWLVCDGHAAFVAARQNPGLKIVSHLPSDCNKGKNDGSEKLSSAHRKTAYPLAS